jgi:hypothetical protein
MQSRTLLAVALLVVAVVCSRTQPQLRNTVGRIKFKQYKSVFPLRRRSLIETDSDRSKIVQNIKKAMQKISQQNHESLSDVSATPVCTGSTYFCGRSTGSSGRALSDVYHPHGNSDNDHHRDDEYFESEEELLADQLRLIETIKPAKIHSTLAPIRFTMTLSDPRTRKTLKHYYRRDSLNRQETLKPTRKPVTMEPKYMRKSKTASGRHMSTKRSSSRYIFDALVMDLKNPNSPFEPELDQQLSVRVNPVKNPNDPFLIEIESDRKAKINYNVKNGREPWDEILSDYAYKTKSYRSPFETNSDNSKENKWKEPKKGKKNVKHF